MVISSELISNLVAANEFVRIGDDVEDLKKSIEAVGLINPIVINGDMEVLSGGRRLTAMRELGHTEITCQRYLEGELDSFIVAIDDNLVRKDLSGVLFDKALSDRKALYECKYPGTKQHSGRAKGDVDSFTTSTAKLLGGNKRAIEKAVARAEGSSPAVNEAREDGSILATHADELIKIPHESQAKVLPICKGKSASQVKDIVYNVKKHGVDKVVDNFSDENYKIFSDLKRRTGSLDKILEKIEYDKVRFGGSPWLEFSTKLTGLRRAIDRLLERQ